MQKRYIHSTLLTCLTGLFGMTSVSVAASQLDESAFLIDIPIVTSATRLSQQQSDAPVAMTVIDRATIAASGAQTVPDLFRLVPGFQVAHVNTNKYAVTYHGHSDDFPRRLEVMIDGRSVYFPIIAAVDWTSLGLHLDDIERIEVIRGSNSATFGSNAFMGAINIITRHPATEPTFALQSTLGSLDTQLYHARFSGTHPAGHYRISASHEQNRGSDLFRDGAEHRYFNLSSSFSPTTRDQVDIWLGIDDGYTHIGSLKPARGTPEQIYIPEKRYNSNFQHIHWQHFLNESTQFGITAYRNYLYLDEQSPNISDLIRSYGLNEAQARLLLESNPGFKFLNEAGTTSQHDIEAYMVRNSPILNSMTGLGIRHSEARSDTLFEQGKVKSIRPRLFNNTIITPNDQWTLNLGALYESETSGPDALSGRIALSWHLTPATTLRAGYSHSERLPSLHESDTYSTIYAAPDKSLIYNAVRRPADNLDTEVIKSHELGLIYNFNYFPGNLDLRLFHEDVSRGIETYRIAFPDPQINGSSTTHTSRNISSWTNKGAEIQLKLQPRNDLWLLLNYAYINSTKDAYHDGNRVLDRDNLTPRHSASALVSWHPRPDLQLSASHYFVDRMHWLEGDLRDAYNRTDLRIAKLWTPNVQTQAELSFTLQNALGPTYQELSYCQIWCTASGRVPV